MTDLIVHFRRPTGWADTVRIHYWNTRPEDQRTQWPGAAVLAEGGGWFVHHFAGVEAASLVFTDGAGRQTGDLWRDREGWYRDGRWYDSHPDQILASPARATPISAAPEGGSSAEAIAPKPAPSAPRSHDIGATPDFREETIYFLITTRFYDGDPSNNFFCRDRIKFNAEGQPEDPHWRGDFKGLIARLDYIRDLGFSAIWITPPVENRSGLDYHGYHPYDWTRIDPRLESSDATYQDLIEEAHALGIKIIQDVVINHSCQFGIRGVVHIDHLPIKYYVPQGARQGEQNYGPYKGNLGNYAWPNRDDIDNLVAPAWYRERHSRDPQGIEPLVDPRSGATVPSPGYNPGRFFGIDPNTLDPNWYHQEGFIMGGDWESAWPLQQKHIAGDCVDLATERQNVKDYIIGAITRYLDMGVDALRIDTVKHIERGNLLEYVNAWKAHKPGLFVFGENLVKGYGWGDMGGGDNGPSQIRPWWYTRLGDDPRDPNSGGDSGFAVLDFGLFSSFRDNLSRGSFEGIAQAMSMDWIYGDPTTLITFLQNHDVGPDNDFRFRFKGEQWMAANAYNVLWCVRGIPCLYYGEDYYTPHLAHASMEPPAAVADYRNGKVVTWTCTQNPQEVQNTVANVLGIKKEDVTCHVTLLGGGFGRKSKPDYVAEAAVLSKKAGKPVKVVWSREDDIKFDYYHSVAALYLKAAVGADGMPTAWLQRSVFPPIGSTFTVDTTYSDSGEMELGWSDLPFAIPHHRAENGPATAHVRIGWLRSVANIYHAFAIHSFVDELAHAAGRDPLEYLQALLGPDRIIDRKLLAENFGNCGGSYGEYPIDTARLRRVAQLAAEKAGWGKRSMGRGEGMGIAMHRSFLTYVATVVRATVDGQGKLRIRQVDTALDAGTIVNRDTVLNQFEGAAVFGTSLALFGEITAKGGVIDQSNFSDYELCRINDAPEKINVHIVESEAPPAGVGEPGVPPFAPALCNAIFAATGRRVRELPLSKAKFV